MNDSIRSWIPVLLLIGWGLLVPKTTFAQWEVSWKSLVRGADNAVLLMSYKPVEKEIPKEIGVEITVRLKD
ncbi:MAG: hypothetical protein AAF388_03195, partial [Bacteroidota bacterium]